MLFFLSELNWWKDKGKSGRWNLQLFLASHFIFRKITRAENLLKSDSQPEIIAIEKCLISSTKKQSLGVDEAVAKMGAWECMKKTAFE